MTVNKRYITGFTLIEMLLVMVIVSGMIVMGANYMTQRTQSLRIDRTSGQMQQILNAAMSYYVSNDTWPTSMSQLTTGGYLPSTITSPWNSAYSVYSTSSNFYVWVRILPAAATVGAITNAKSIAGTLPLAFTTVAMPSASTSPANCVAGSPCYVVSTVNVPPQKLGDGKAVSFAGLYHNGACVVAPTCPTNYKPQAFAVPVAINGYYTGPGTGSSPCNATDKSGCDMTYYPLSGFSAYTTSSDPVNYTAGSSMPVSCGTGVTTTSACDDTVNSSNVATPMSNGIRVWRVCVSVMTQSGEVKPVNDSPTSGDKFANPWGQLTGTVMVMTRCTPTAGEETGSDFTVWQPNG